MKACSDFNIIIMIIIIIIIIIIIHTLVTRKCSMN